MSKSNGARNLPHQRCKRKAARPNLVGGAAAAIAVLGCSWTLYANIFAASIYPSISADSEPVRRVERPISFAARFEPLANAAAGAPMMKLASAPAAPAETSAALVATAAPAAATVVASVAPAKKKPNQYSPLMDANYSLGTEPETFRIRDSETTAALPPAAAVVAARPAALQASAPPQQLALNVPTPPPRPSLARVPQPAQTSRAFGHESLVARAKAAIMASASARKSSIFEKLFGSSSSDAPVLAYASADGGVASDGRDSTFTASPDDRVTAVYDISAKTVYMPNGNKLEAHSGLGDKLDNPRYAHVRMQGVTPPHVYDLTPREALFHGVAALRLNPVGGEDVIFGRTGLLAHTYMLGSNGDSNGCVSFKNYDAFLQAFRRGEVKKLVVVASLN
jgi:hypothetical protein